MKITDKHVQFFQSRQPVPKIIRDHKQYSKLAYISIHALIPIEKPNWLTFHKELELNNTIILIKSKMTCSKNNVVSILDKLSGDPLHKYRSNYCARIIRRLNLIRNE